MPQSTVNTLFQVFGTALVLLGGFVTLFINERSKRREEEYKRKEERYSELIKTLRGFYVDSLNKDLRDTFLQQINLCWLYCPDEVIRKAYMFLSMVQVDTNSSDLEKEHALGEFILSIRKDLISRRPVKKTSLTTNDFKHITAT